ncbi:carbamoyl phosphate synthase large subunit [Helicobacter sp. CLO-3]|uniref:carbamoyl-phosphate synthase large subunit n=1 Tax=unclassified Helicobacter TaxID=2593540 RepID=UPI000804CD5F|nr:MULTISPECIES: carbamoyl-phosphate synthase large subunit [unclassified Helicobacter]OBV28737.1 carbamoyl phosphate synthase large subunit [Helicobacter sp. CLO-3]OHU81389.1 carbamoyl phosphate synthase large subunit [Helicobacter sp. CLO-3]
MPKRNDIHTILLIGSGPIVIGQACEFDYSGTQAAKTLKSLGYRVVLINSNPATIMTDPDFAHRTYIEPITEEIIANIIKQEKVDAILPTMGGQTALNVAMSMYEKGMLEGIEFLGAKPDAIKKGEDRQAFKEAMLKIGMDLPKSRYAYNEDEALEAAKEIGFPLIIRASYTLAGGGSGVAYNIEEFRILAKAGLEASPISEILIEESLLGWKEFEMEVIRDKFDNCIIVCSIENLDPMGVHTGDSITIAPALTLTDKEYQRMRDASFKILREIGVDTGGSNVQFAINPQNGRMTVIEMNPRVSRSSALASKATGYPIAKVATLLAVGFSLDEIKNDITGTPASFEPSIDYIVTKIPRFTFEKFPNADSTLTTSMKSIGEVMGIGGSFKESLQKALCSLEVGYFGLNTLTSDIEVARAQTRRPNATRLLYIADCFRLGLSIDEVYELCHVDRWFLSQIYELIQSECAISSDVLHDAKLLRAYKSQGFSDRMICEILNKSENLELRESELFAIRQNLGVVAQYEEVDTCAAEFEALTPYMYSTFPLNPLAQMLESSGAESENTSQTSAESRNADSGALDSDSTNNNINTSAESKNADSSALDSDSTKQTSQRGEICDEKSRLCRSEQGDKAGAPIDEASDKLRDLSHKANAQKKVLIIGGGPNRIGQGIEFDYCCVHASFALRDLGVKSIMYNCNPETVSTDYDTSDMLYFEPIDFEHIHSLILRENPDGIIVHFGGQTPLKLSKYLTTINAKIIGTSARVIDIAEDRKKFSAFAQKLALNQPQNGSATSKDEAFSIANHIGYPVLVRPSYVLGGRAMRVVQDDDELRVYMDEAVKVSEDSPVLIDKFLDHAIELDVDAVCDGKEVYIGGIMQHIEEAGVHSGDSTSMLPSVSIEESMLAEIRATTEKIALELGIIGLLNIQYAIHNGVLFLIEVNPRASRTVPFVSKATGIPLAKVATRVMWQGDLREALRFYDANNRIDFTTKPLEPKKLAHIALKVSVFPFNKLSGADLILGPEMKSTGEVMGISHSFGISFAKAQNAAKNTLPKSGKIFLSLADCDKPFASDLARAFIELGFEICATKGTHERLSSDGLASQSVLKISEGRPNIQDLIMNKEIAMVINTSDDGQTKSDSANIRRQVLKSSIPYFTTIAGAQVAARSILESKSEDINIPKALQDYL